MTGHQLTLWEILAMIKQGFVHAFISSQQKERFLKQIDGQMYRILSTWGEEI
jgi:adenosine deaminase